MNVLIDTSVWSLALRRNPIAECAEVGELAELVRELRVQLIGPVRQEILSGVKGREQFHTLRNYLRAFPDLDLSCRDYELAAEFYNVCRSKGIQGSNTDFLICAASAARNLPIFTTDADFSLYKSHLPISLHGLRK